MTGQAPGAARSLLFVPAGDERLLAKAHLRGAHGLVLDLEDAVPESGKEAARRALPGHIDRLAAEGQYLVVRTGSVREEWEKDLRAALRPGLRAVMLPKAEHPEQLAGMAAFLDAAERERGLPEGAVGLIALIESCGRAVRARRPWRRHPGCARWRSAARTSRWRWAWRPRRRC